MERIHALPRIVSNRQIIAGMVKTKKTSRLQGAPTRPVSAAAKDPTKTSTFLDTIDTMLETFDDEISSVSADARQAAYHNLVTAYHQALSTIWDKAGLVNIDAILESVTDK